MTTDQSFFQAIEMIVFDSSDMEATYLPLNPGGFSDDIKIMKIINASTQGFTASYDNGTTDQDFFPATAANTNPIPCIINFQTNHACNASNGSGTLYGHKGQVITGKGTAGTGNIYIIGYR